MAGEDFPAPSEGFVVTHFIVAADVARSRDFYTGVLGGTVVLDGEPTIVKLANGWVIINVGGGPTDDKPEVILEPPPTPTRPVPSWTSAWPTSRPSTGTGAPRGRYSSPAQGPRPRDPLLHARPGWSSDRGRPDDRRSARPVTALLLRGLLPQAGERYPRRRRPANHRGRRG